MLGIKPAFILLDWVENKKKAEAEIAARRNNNSERVRPINVLSRAKTHRVDAILDENTIRLAPLHQGVRGGLIQLNTQAVRNLKKGDYVKVS